MSAFVARSAESFDRERRAAERGPLVLVNMAETQAARILSEGARELAGAALSALSDKKLVMVTEGQKHVMLSYQWNAQAAIKRTNESLIARGYVTWFDLTNMKGSTMDAMSDAIEG